MALPRRSFGDLLLPLRIVQSLAWGAITVAFALPGAAWVLGWVEPPPPPPPPVADVAPARPRVVLTEPRTEDDADCPGMPPPTGSLAGDGGMALSLDEPLRFIDLSAGEFNRGANSSTQMACHRVRLDAFKISTTLVTNAQWKLLMGTPRRGCKQSCGLREPVSAVRWDEAIEFLIKMAKSEGIEPCYAKKPRGQITWKAGCTGYRLPTEAEWEYAVRAGSVGHTNQKNAWGFVVYGFKHEWVWDRYDAFKASAATVANPLGPDRHGPVVLGADGLRVIRARPDARSGQAPMKADALVGFRVARGPR